MTLPLAESVVCLVDAANRTQALPTDLPVFRAPFMRMYQDLCDSANEIRKALQTHNRELLAFEVETLGAVIDEAANLVATLKAAHLPEVAYQVAVIRELMRDARGPLTSLVGVAHAA